MQRTVARKINNLSLKNKKRKRTAPPVLLGGVVEVVEVGPDGVVTPVPSPTVIEEDPVLK